MSSVSPPIFFMKFVTAAPIFALIVFPVRRPDVCGHFQGSGRAGFNFGRNFGDVFVLFLSDFLFAKQEASGDVARHLFRGKSCTS